MRQVAAAYEIKGENRFRIIAYQQAADAVERVTSDVKDLWDDGELNTIPGVGSNIAQHLDELFRRGKVKHFEQVMKGLPSSMFSLIDVPGFGAKTAYKLVKVLGIKLAKGWSPPKADGPLACAFGGNQELVVKKLIEAAKDHKISKIEGFGEKSEAKILENLLEYQKKQKQPRRILLAQALKTAEGMISYLKDFSDVIRVDPLGSLRRMVSTVGDIDIAVAAKKNKAVIEYFARYPKAKKVIEAGAKTSSIVLENGFQIDLMVQPPESYGALLQHFTGSKHHNIHLREVALSKGMSLSEYGIKKKGGKVEKYADEKNLYKALGMDWIPPELREDAGEIEAAIICQLPKLVEPSDIKGDLHVHSSFDIEPSHDLGENTIEEMIGEAERLGYSYLGFTEHNPSRSKHSDRQVIALIKARNRVIDKFISSRKNSVKNWGVKILKNLEIDILPDGNLAVPNEGLELLDGVIAAIHTVFNMNREKMTERVLKALKNPFVRILAHPTGRMLNKREGFELDWDKVFRFCLERNKALEINAWPSRLDLPDILVKEAVKKGVKLVISSDAHARKEMEVMRFGVAVARRGWAERGDILNTLGYNELVRWLRTRS